MKTLEITVVRTYTTTIEVEVPSDTTEIAINNAVTGDYDAENDAQGRLYAQVWDCLAEQELEQMDTDLLTYYVKEIANYERQ